MARVCKYFENAERRMECSDTRKCEECRLAPLFESLVNKGVKEGKASMEEALEEARKNHSADLNNLIRLQNQFCVHDKMGRPVLITASEVICAKEAKIGTDSIIITTKGKIRCSEPLEIVESKRRGTYDLY